MHSINRSVRRSVTLDRNLQASLIGFSHATSDTSFYVELNVFTSNVLAHASPVLLPCIISILTFPVVNGVVPLNDSRIEDLGYHCQQKFLCFFKFFGADL